jgi:Uma2 family endonuclease
MQLELKQLDIPSGQRVLLKDVNWQMFESILNELGNHRAARLAYDNGTLEIMAPLPEHEKSKEIISDFVKVLLEELNIDCECFGSTTFKRQDILKGVEPDQCFYIQNEATMRGKDKLDLTVDPPPDLVIEIDITSDSRTRFSIYEALGVPELWRYNGLLQINLLQNGKYVESNYSQNFPELPILEVIPQFVAQSKTAGRSPTLRAFKTWVREQLH